ncbi:ENV2 protein, partial [Alcedo cyanopectus]|nr:ENV2 protein [Ceyx cyanopectus]
LWKLLNTTYLVLNSTNLNIMAHCWLCYDIRPPFYEAIGIASEPKVMSGNIPPQCRWGTEKENSPGVTMQHVSGQGSCIG